MRYSDFTQRIAGDGAAAWDIHYRALARVEQGEEILLLSVGDPDFDTPAPIVQAAIDSLLAGNTHYADVRGKRALRQRIAERHRRRSGQAVDAEQVWGGGSFGAGERVASDGWRPDTARVSGVGASNVQPNRNGMDCEITARFRKFIVTRPSRNALSIEER
ncbi:TPA: aminotransferase class I/II-fold pyridoxal phosphate-dependent enzyme [Pseudomonas aeruginosa]